MKAIKASVIYVPFVTCHVDDEGGVSSGRERNGSVTNARTQSPALVSLGVLERRRVQVLVDDF